MLRWNDLFHSKFHFMFMPPNIDIPCTVIDVKIQPLEFGNFSLILLLYQKYCWFDQTPSYILILCDDCEDWKRIFIVSFTLGLFDLAHLIFQWNIIWAKVVSYLISKKRENYSLLIILLDLASESRALFSLMLSNITTNMFSSSIYCFIWFLLTFIWFKKKQIYVFAASFQSKEYHKF